MSVRISKSRVLKPEPNIFLVTRGIGQTVKLHLPGGGMLEVEVEEVRGDVVGLSFAVTKPLKFVDMDE